MLWQVRALLPDRPGAMASLASRCGVRGANILALDVHPSADGEVVDELVIHTPAGWSKADVEQLCAEAGVFDCAVADCTAHSLEDQPARYLRAARALVREPERLEELLCRMLDARPAESHGPVGLLMDDEDGPLVAISRDLPFTATEQARAAELRLVAAAASDCRHDTSTEPVPVGVGALRKGSLADVAPLVAMHERCSAETLRRRYHAPMRRLPARLAREMLLPADGFSLVLPDSSGDAVVAMGMVTFQQDGEVEAALLVEDGWQRRGHGTALLRALAVEAAKAGASDLTLITRREDTAVLAAVHRAGLRAHVRCVDGANTLRVPLGALSRQPRAERGGRRRVTEPLVALLHERSELREVYAPADIIDRAVRDGV